MVLAGAGRVCVCVCARVRAASLFAVQGAAAPPTHDVRKSDASNRGAMIQERVR